jgi:c-di-GMP-binding flagellar brake protein YcgR
MNRRRQYRVTAEFDKYVQLELLGPKVHARQVKLIDLSSGGCAVVLPAGANGLLRRRDLVNLRVISQRLPEHLDMHGKVAWLKESDRRPVVGLTFVDWRQHRALLDTDLKGLFNEREAYRVSPDMRHPPTVTLGIGDDPLEGKLRDVSFLGLGVSVRTDLLPQQPALEVVRTSLLLPSSPVLVEARAEVLYIRAEAEHKRAHMGLRLLEPDKLPGPMRRAVQQYVMERQRELLRMGVREIS